MKLVRGAIGVIIGTGRVLICQRKPGKHLAGLWEFPGGKIEDGESAQQALHREIREEIGVEIKLLGTLPTIEHDYPDFRVGLTTFLCEIARGQPKPIESERIEWVSAAELRSRPFPPANEALIDAVAAILNAKNFDSIRRSSEP